MKTVTKVGLIVSLSMIVAGISLCVIPVAMSGGNMVDFFNDKREKRDVSVDKPYKYVTVNAPMDNVELDFSVNNNESYVELYDSDRYKFDVYVDDETLYIGMEEQNMSITGFINGGISPRKITVHLVGGEDKLVNVNTGIGSLDIKGNMYIEELHVNTGIGDVDISKDTLLGKVYIKTGIGSVTLPKASDAVQINTGIGNVHTHAIKDKSGSVNIDTGIGSVNVH